MRQITWRRWSEFGFGSVMTMVVTYVNIVWNWCCIFRKHTLFSSSYEFPWRFGSLLCMWAKPVISSKRAQYSNYQIKEFTFSAYCLCAGKGGMLLRSKRTAFGSVEGRINWVLLQQNHPNASEFSCAESEGVQSWLHEKATPDKMSAAPATQWPVKLKASVWCYPLSTGCSIKPLNLSCPLDRVHCSFISSSVTPGLMHIPGNPKCYCIPYAQNCYCLLRPLQPDTGMGRWCPGLFKSWDTQAYVSLFGLPLGLFLPLLTTGSSGDSAFCNQKLFQNEFYTTFGQH